MGNIKDLLNGLALGATFATGIGFIQYARGSWPFTEVPDNEFHITQWFNEKKGPVLEGPDTVWFISPIIKKVTDESNKVIAIPRRGQQRDIKNLEYLAEDGTSGTIDLQYRWHIPNKDDARKFYWKIEGKEGIEDEIECRIAQVDEVLKGRLKEKISHRPGIPGSLLERVYLNKLVLELNGYKLLEELLEDIKGNITVKEIDGRKVLVKEETIIGYLYQIDAFQVITPDIDKKFKSIYTEFGVEITDLSLFNPRPTPGSLAILQTPLRTQAQSEATRKAIETYVEVAKELAQLSDEQRRIVLRLSKQDNHEDLAARGVTTIFDMEGSPQQIIPFPITSQNKNQTE